MKERIIIIVLLIVIISLVLFKIFLGHLDIRLKGKYNNPIYRLQLNDKYYGMNMEINYNINIIPQTLTFIKTANSEFW